ncbi:hypothetical protein [Kushneria aurantia]|uniref:Glycosyl transferase n=1 Tax=Kushneria aurantia TaxID=504092 RepID=A0ABV6FZ59_9GAMM|nr:hypothetical protein [Kushneria aurantia]
MSRADRERHWASIGESGSTAGIRLMLAIHERLGMGVFRAVLAPVTLYYWLRRPLARRASREYQHRLRHFCPGVRLPRLATLAHFTSFGTAMLERILALHGRLDLDRVRVMDRDRLAAAIESGRGGLIVVSHLGNHEICQLLGRLRPELSMSLVMHTHHARRFNALFDDIERPMAVELIEVSDMGPATAQRLQARIAAGGFVVIAADRDPIEQHARRRDISFLGATAPFPEGAFWLATLLRCPLYFLICARHQGHYHVHFESLGDGADPSRRERSTWIATAMTLFVERLEHYCCRYPLQWFNFYAFWHARSATPEQRVPESSGS